MTEIIDAPVAFDPDKFRQATRAQWEAAAGAWDRWGPLLAGALIASVPVAVLYTFFIDHFVAGLTAVAGE